MWDLASGKCIHVLAGHSGRVNTVTVSEDGATLITASDDSTARVWDANSGECRAVLDVRITSSNNASNIILLSFTFAGRLWTLFLTTKYYLFDFCCSDRGIFRLVCVSSKGIELCCGHK